MKSLLIMTIVASMALACGNVVNDNQGTQSSGKVISVSVEEFSKIIKQKDVWLIDVRTAKEYSEGHIFDADNIDVNQDDFIDKAKKNMRYNPAETKVAVYCRSGKRSMKAANLLSEEGFTVYNLEGGILAWHKSYEVAK